jgi:hypothetical protein
VTSIDEASVPYVASTIYSYSLLTQPPQAGPL